MKPAHHNDPLPARALSLPSVAKGRAGTDLYGDLLPAGALARLGTSRFRRDALGLAGLAFLPDGRTIITADQDYAVQLWDTAGRLRHEIRTEPVAIESFALAPDGKQFAVAVCNRLGLVQTRDPIKIEKQVCAMVPRREWTGFSLRLILHGRRICVARNPKCEQCILNDFCPSSTIRPKPRRRASP